MMLKCGQKDNTKYTFGLRKEQREENKVAKEAMRMMQCSSCGKKCRKGSSFCSSCGAKL